MRQVSHPFKTTGKYTQGKKVHHKTFQTHPLENCVHNTKYNFKITIHRTKPQSGKV
jgi:hypothetical protein